MSATRWLQWLVIGNGVLLCIQAIRVIATYSAVYSVTTGPRRTLPLHVWLIATSYLGYVGATTYFLWTTGDTPTGLARAIIFAITGVIGQYALYNVLSYERRRYSSVTNFIDDEADSE